MVSGQRHKTAALPKETALVSMELEPVWNPTAGS